MDYLWSPWRYRYITGEDPKPACVFCDIAGSAQDEENLVVHRGKFSFVVLNLYPYTSGHLMIVPYQHVARLSDAAVETCQEIMSLARSAEKSLWEIYRPDGLNMGLNEGKSAGAGVAGHIHMHVLPRWTGDAGFLTTVSETRILPEELGTTYRKLREACLHW